MYLQKHFVYEVKMLIKAKEKFVSTEGWDQIVAVESLLLHGRNIIEFLFYGKKTNYVRVENILNKNKHKKLKEKFSENHLECFANDYSDKVNIYLSHMSIKRDERSLKWDIKEKYYNILNAIQIFLQILSENIMTNEVVKINNMIQKELKEKSKSQKTWEIST